MSVFPITDAFTNIKKACEEAITLKYPARIPAAARDRLEAELTLLQNNDTVHSLELIRRLYQEARRSSQYLSGRELLPGSFIYHLLSSSLMNPLPAHYYCPTCGHYEEVHTSLFGPDLPEKICPNCGATMGADGFNIRSESVWNIDGLRTYDISLNCSENFYPFAKRVLMNAYPTHQVIPYGIYYRDTTSSKNALLAKLEGYVILPEGRTVEDYADMHAYLDDGELCITGNIIDIESHFMKLVTLHNSQTLNYLVQMQQKTGHYIEDITLSDIRTLRYNNYINTTALSETAAKLFQELKPRTFTAMLKLEASTLNTYVDVNGGFIYGNYDKLIDIVCYSKVFQEHPIFTREDLYDILLDLGVVSEDAFNYSECARKGMLSKGRLPDRYKKISDLEIPESLKSIAKSYVYLGSRVTSAEWLLTCGALAYLIKNHSRIFSKISK